VRVFGIDPGSIRTGYGCVDTDGRRHQLVVCGAIAAGTGAFPDRLGVIYRGLSTILRDCKPDCVAVESLFHAVNVRSALKLGHARGVAMLAAVEFGVPVVEYSPAEVKRAVVGYGRAEKTQVQQMIKLLLGLDSVPEPNDAADALAVAICHLHANPTHLLNSRPGNPVTKRRDVNSVVAPSRALPKTWRHYKPA
jgi:crossover junction endodeoxyribonuclease RuvC